MSSYLNGDIVIHNLILNLKHSGFAFGLIVLFSVLCHLINVLVLVPMAGDRMHQARVVTLVSQSKIRMNLCWPPGEPI